MNLTFLKKKQDGGWEKPSNKEGLVVKIGLEEIAAINEVLGKGAKEFKTVHAYKEKKTPINVSWGADKGEKKTDIVWFNVGGYKIYLTHYQIQVCYDLFNHCYEEKIAQSTVSDQQPKISEGKAEELAHEEVVEPTLNEDEPVPSDTDLADLGLDSAPDTELLHDSSDNVHDEPALEDTAVIKAAINGSTDKAIKVSYNGKDVWLPKSKIHSQFDANKKEAQSFIIEKWLLKKME